MGLLLFEGLGVPRDLTKAVHLLVRGKDLYSTFFADLADRELGKVAEGKGLIEQLLKARPVKGWSQSIARFLLDEMPEGDLLRQATGEKDATVRREACCEAYFFAGYVRLLHGDRAVAKDYFQKCLDQDFPSHPESIAAKAALGRLGSSTAGKTQQPPHPR